MYAFAISSAKFFNFVRLTSRVLKLEFNPLEVGCTEHQSSKAVLSSISGGRRAPDVLGAFKISKTFINADIALLWCSAGHVIVLWLVITPGALRVLSKLVGSSASSISHNLCSVDFSAVVTQICVLVAWPIWLFTLTSNSLARLINVRPS